MALDKSKSLVEGEIPGGNGEDTGNGDSEDEEPVEPPVDPDNPEPEPEQPEPEPTYIYQTINNFYNRVRGALGAGLSITDDMIDLYEYAPYAELQIVKRVPNFCCLSDIKYALFETCIVYMTCYALCPIASQMKIKRQKDPSLELEFMDSTKMGDCNRFLELIDDIITCQINEEEREYFVGFKVTKASPSIPNALGENVCCCRHWFPPIYRELYMKPVNGSNSPSDGDNNASWNRPCCCPCVCTPTTPEQPETPPNTTETPDNGNGEGGENTKNPEEGNDGTITEGGDG